MTIQEAAKLLHLRLNLLIEPDDQDLDHALKMASILMDAAAAVEKQCLEYEARHHPTS